MTPDRPIAGFSSAPVATRPSSSGLSTRRFGMRLFLLALGILFAAGLVGHLVIRLRAAEWPPPGSPGLPGGLWISTAILAVLSALLVAVVRWARARDRARLRRGLVATTALGVAFLVAQAGNWGRMAATDFVPQQSLYAFGFYVLTFLHAVHVLGGLVPLVITTLRARSGRYDHDCEPVELVASYWHFLGATWLAIFLVLMI
jgi:heme/copper-type cytochrome/quinol oxidase subunit 3